MISFCSATFLCFIFRLFDSGGKRIYFQVEASHWTWFVPTPLNSLIWSHSKKISLPDFKDFCYVITFLDVVLHLSLLQISLFHCTSKFPYGNGKALWWLIRYWTSMYTRILDACLQLRQNHQFLSSVAFEGSREDFWTIIWFLVVFIHVHLPFLTAVCTFR